MPALPAGEQWLATFLSASYQQLPSMSSQHCAVICWALARLDVTPAPQWLSALCRRLQQISGDMNKADVDMLTWAFETKFGPQWLTQGAQQRVV